MYYYHQYYYYNQLKLKAMQHTRHAILKPPATELGCEVILAYRPVSIAGHVTHCPKETFLIHNHQRNDEKMYPSHKHPKMTFCIIRI